MAVRNARLPLTLALHAVWVAVAVAGVLSSLFFGEKMKNEKPATKKKAFSPHAFHTVISLVGMTRRCYS